MGGGDSCHLKFTLHGVADEHGDGNRGKLPPLRRDCIFYIIEKLIILTLGD